VWLCVYVGVCVLCEVGERGMVCVCCVQRWFVLVYVCLVRL